MLSTARNNQFRFNLPRNFFYDSVRAAHHEYFQRLPLPYEDLSDFINSTIVSVDFPSITDSSDHIQVGNKGKERQFKSAKHVAEQTDKELTIGFKLKEGFYNWVVLYDQMIAFLNRNNPEEYQPDVYLQILDSENYIISQIIFKEVRMTEVEGLKFDSSDNGIEAKDFSIKLAFNYFSFSIETNKRIN